MRGSDKRFPMIRSAFFICALLTASLVSFSASAQGVPKAAYGDWSLRCETKDVKPTPPSATAAKVSDSCALVQSVVAEDRANMSLMVIVLKSTETRNYLMRVVAPLGVLLPSGLGLKIDQTDIGQTAFVRCLSNGCIAEVVLEETLVKSLKTGKTALFLVYNTPDDGVGLPVSLNGFAPGFDQLR
jgi:invasion protein IalB